MYIVYSVRAHLSTSYSLNEESDSVRWNFLRFYFFPLVDHDKHDDF